MTIEEKRWTEKDISQTLDFLDFETDEMGPSSTAHDAASIIRQQRAELAELRKKQKAAMDFLKENVQWAGHVDGRVMFEAAQMLEAVSAEKEREQG